MTVLVVHHSVRDVSLEARVRRARVESTTLRAERHWVYRTVEDPNDVVVAVEFESEEGARAFLDDRSLREAMEGAGVEGEPHVHFRERVEAVEY